MFLDNCLTVVFLVMEATKEANGAAKYDVSAKKIPAVANPLAEKPLDIASNINYHAQYSPHFSPFKFEPEQAYYAAAESVRDRLVQVIFLASLLDYGYKLVLNYS